jgi:hypothetical protein
MTVLKAPDSFIGRTVHCPACRQQFGVPANAGAAATDESTGSTAAGQSEPQDVTLAADSAGTARPQDGSPVELPPTSIVSRSPPPAPAPAAPAVSASRMPPPAPTTGRAQPPPPPADRRHRRKAKFIAADATATQIEVGKDGQLPQLKLEDAEQSEQTKEKSRSSNPLLLVLALAVSTSMSVGLLFWDNSAEKSETALKAEARQTLREHYIHTPPEMEPYKMLLRRALQAHYRGEFAAERRLYRQVLDMLHAEDKNRGSNRKGLTGLREEQNNRPPNDQHLKQQLTILLKDD